MKCPFLTGRRILYCEAKGEAYVPSIFELGEYCKNEKYTICPFYLEGVDEKSPDAAHRAEDLSHDDMILYKESNAQ